MKALNLRYVLVLALLLNSRPVMAAGELVLHVFDQGLPMADVEAMLDGDEARFLTRTGKATFDLEPGPHNIELRSSGVRLYSFRFDSAPGQLVDISVSLQETGNPLIAVESYYTTETASQRAKAPQGSVKGTITSEGAPVEGATVHIVGTKISAVTDSRGRYNLAAPRGVYPLRISHPDIGKREVRQYRVVSNITRGSNFNLPPEDDAAVAGVAATGVGTMPAMIEEVVIMAKMDTSAFGDERYASNVVDAIGVEQLARFGDTDVAASVVRVPSVTVQEGRFVFIRGLGGRYISTTLNGSTLPSTNPTKRTVPLDLFPTTIVEELAVQKTFLPSMPGESTGGNLAITTRSFPDQSAGQLTGTFGWIPGLTGQDVYVDPNSGGLDWLGWDDGTRSLPGEVSAINEALKYQDFYSDDIARQLNQIAGLALSEDLDLKTETANPNVILGVNYGNVFDIGDRSDIGFFVGLNYRNEWQQRTDGTQRTYRGVGASVLQDDFSFDENQNVIDASGLFSLGANVGDNTFTSNTILSRVTEERVRVSDGFDGDALELSTRWVIEWVERQFLSQQFVGQHLFGSSDQAQVDWQITASQATRKAPDRRDVRFDLSGDDGIYNLEVPFLTRRYDDLTDNNYDFSSDFDYLLPSTSNFDSNIGAGIQLIARDRDSDSETYGFTGGQMAVDDNSPNKLVSEVLNSGTITGDPDTGYAFQDKTLASDSYEADMTLYAAYAEYDMTWLGKYQFILGARYEDYEQNSKTAALSGAQEPIDVTLAQDDILPSLNFNWFITDSQQLRFAVSQTVSRPDFKELANAVFYDVEFDIRVRGNPDLKISSSWNYDARWEKYWSDLETVSVALFYKDLTDPIERVVVPASGTAGNSRTFINADSAQIYGIEVDGRKDFPLNKAYDKSFFIAANASWIESEVNIPGQASRSLQGQPDYTFNLILGYDDIGNGHELTLLFNQNGEAIVDVGVAGLPDIVEEPRLDMNINYKYYITPDLAFRARVKNALNSQYEFTQGGNTFQSYKRGTEFQAGIDWRF